MDGLGKLLKKYDKPTIKDKAKALGTAAVGIAEAASEVAESVVGVDCLDILKDSISPIKELIKALSKSQKDNALFEEYTSYHELVNRIKDILNKITASSTKKQADKSRRLIILVDEVDRCLPDEQLRILERLHHLFDINNCVVICAMNNHCIRETIKTIYGTDGSEYLRKFFDYQYHLETNSDFLIQALLNKIGESFSKIIQNRSVITFGHNNNPVQTAIYCLVNSSGHPLEKVNNREIYRYYTALNNLINEIGWDQLTNEELFFLIISLLIRMEISSKFLEAQDIVENVENICVGGSEREMPYYDYLLKYIGIDRTNLSNILSPYNNQLSGNIASFSWYFNEIIHYSVDEEPVNNSMRIFFNQPTVHHARCKQLRELVMKYAGEKD